MLASCHFNKIKKKDLVYFMGLEFLVHAVSALFVSLAAQTTMVEVHNRGIEGYY